MKRSFTYRHLANIITLTRIAGVVSIFWLTPFQSVTTQLWTIIIFAIVSSTDFLDGWVARRFNIVTDLGKILDPLADKILILVFLPLLEMQVISSFPVFIILAREFAIMALRVVSAKKGTIVAANMAGKLKTAFTLPVCGLLLAWVPISSDGALPTYFNGLYQVLLWVQSWPSWVMLALIWATVAITIWSFMDYFGDFILQELSERVGGNKKEARRLFRMLIPNTVSVINLINGCFAIYFAVNGSLKMAVQLMLISTFLDALDGRLARKLQVESSLGATLDSRADMISFGVTPAVIAYHLIHGFSMPYADVWAWGAGILIFAAVVYRLRRFDEGGHSDYFDGLPSPVGASLLALPAVSVYLSDSYVYWGIVIGVSLLMVSKIPYLHNHASKKTFLGYFHLPTLLLFFATIVSFIPYISEILLPFQQHIIHGFFAFILIYVLSPFVFYLKR